MFNDFKRFHFGVIKNKLQKLTDIFDRLNLVKLEQRYLNILNSLSELDGKIDKFGDWYRKNVVIPRRYPIITPPVEPTGFPDLEIVSIIPTVYSNHIDFEVTIKNIGTAYSPATTLSSVILDLLTDSIIVPNLLPDTEVVKIVTYLFPVGEFDVVSKDLTVTVNPSHTFIESDYTNNTSTLTTLVRVAHVSDPTEAYVIVHCHNPEGLEISSIGDAYYRPNRHLPITTMGLVSLDLLHHGAVVPITPGIYSCISTFNGISIDLGNIDFVAETITELVFDFPRTIADFDYTVNASKNYQNEIHYTDETDTNVTTGDIYKVEDSVSMVTTRFFDDSSYNLIVNLIVNSLVAVNISKTSFTGLVHNTLTGFCRNFTFGSDSGEGGLITGASSSIRFTRLSPKSLDMPLEINLSFLNWIVQSKSTGYYPGIVLYDDTDTKGMSIGFASIPSQYRTALSPSNIRYTKMRVWELDIGARAPSVSWGHTAESKAYDIITPFNGTADIKITSVPYDMIGNAW